MAKKIGLFFIGSIIGIIRFIVVGLLSALFLIYNIDGFTRSEFGTNNLVLIVAAFSFIPLFLALFVEFGWYAWKKEKRIKMKKQKSIENLKK